MFVWSYVKLWLLVILIFVQAQTPGWNVFTYPPKDPIHTTTYVAGEYLNINWIASSPTGPVSIFVLGGVLNITILPAIASGIDSSLSSYMWQIPSTLPKYEFYDLQITLDSDHSFFQRALAPFNVTVRNATTSSHPISSTSTIQSLLLSAPTTTATDTSLPPLTPNKDTNTGFSTGTKAGIGIGAGLGGLFFLIAIVLLVRAVKRRRAGNRHQSTTPNWWMGGKSELSAEERADVKSQGRPAELQGSNVRQELHGDENEGVERRPSRPAEME